MLEELLGANEAILKALEMYDAIASGKDVPQSVGLLCRSTMQCPRSTHVCFRAGPTMTPPPNNVSEILIHTDLQ